MANYVKHDEGKGRRSSVIIASPGSGNQAGARNVVIDAPSLINNVHQILVLYLIEFAHEQESSVAALLRLGTAGLSQAGQYHVGP